MPRHDLYHDVVKQALIKDGWTITDDPLYIEFGDDDLYADLGAEKLFAAEKGARKIAVEIKTFSSASPITELERAIGQYTLYHHLLTRMQSGRVLYLAIAQDVEEDFFQRPAVREFIKAQRIPLLIFEPTRVEIVAWTS